LHKHGDSRNENGTADSLWVRAEVPLIFCSAREFQSAGGIPAPLGFGKLELADGPVVNGLVYEGIGVADAQEITEYGGCGRGWRGAESLLFEQEQQLFVANFDHVIGRQRMGLQTDGFVV
jgi:hypothetical protein